jgi:hypothetical protein
MCVGPKGTVWASITEANGLKDVPYVNHLVSYRPGEKAPRDHGPVAIGNPNYTEFTDKNGKPVPFTAGVVKLADGTTTSKWVILGVCEGHDGSVYSLMLQPYTVLQVKADQLK